MSRISKSEAAKRLGCSARAVQKWVMVGLLAEDETGRVDFGAAQRAANRKRRSGRRTGRGKWIVKDKLGRLLHGAEAERKIEQVKRIFAVRVLAHVLTELQTTRDLDAAVRIWNKGRYSPSRLMGKWLPVEKKLARSLQPIPSAKMIEVLSAQWLCEIAKSFPWPNRPVRFTKQDWESVPREKVMAWPGGVLAIKKLSVNGKIRFESSKAEALRVLEQVERSTLARRARGLQPRRESDHGYTMRSFLPGMSRRMVCYWWGKSKGHWPLFMRTIRDVMPAPESSKAATETFDESLRHYVEEQQQV